MLKTTDLKQLIINPFTTIGEEWMLITAGNEQKYNMMTASWGGLGVLWGKNVSSIYIRPQRYTLEFLDSSDYYSLSVFGKEYRSALAYCGAHSGRDVDKVKETGLTPVFNSEAPFFEEAKLVLVCRKLYKQKLEPDCFSDISVNSHCYPENDHHFLFVGEIVEALSTI